MQIISLPSLFRAFWQKQMFLLCSAFLIWALPAHSTPCQTPTPPVITGPSQFCAGTGNVTLNAGSGFASYLWSPGGQTTQTISAGPGTYSVSVVDGNGCSGTSAAFTVTENPLPQVIAVPGDETCPGSGNGVITVVGNAGTMPYDFSINNGISFISGNGVAQAFTGLTSGTYPVVMKDANNCLSAVSNAIISSENTASTPLTSYSASINPVCPGENTVLSVSGGVDGTGASIKWYTGPNGTGFNVFTGPGPITITSSNPVFNYYVRREGLCNTTEDLVVSIYGDTVRPVLTCQNFQTTLNEFGNITISPWDVIASATDANCRVDSFSAYVTPNNFSAPGTFNVVAYIQDVSNNLDTCHAKVTILPRCDVSFTTSKTEEFCDLDEDGSITVTATGGGGNYEFSKDGGNTWIAAASPYPFTNLPDGTYDLQVRDADSPDCVADIQTVSLAKGYVVDFTASTTDATCADREDGAIDVQLIGQAPFQLLVDGAMQSLTGNQTTLNHLGAGEYDLQVLDATGCSSELRTITTGANNPPSFDVNVTHESAPGANDGAITVVASSGVPPFLFSEDNGNSFVPGVGNTHLFTAKTVGIYDLLVQDGNGCLSSRLPVLVSGAGFCPPSSLLDQVYEAHPGEAGKNARFLCEDQPLQLQYEVKNLSGLQAFYFDWEVSGIQGKKAGDQPTIDGVVPATDGSVGGMTNPVNSNTTYLFDGNGKEFGLGDKVSTLRRVSIAVQPYLINDDGTTCPANADTWKVYVYPRAQLRLDNANAPGTPIVINSGDDPAGTIEIEQTSDINEKKGLLLYDVHIDPNSDILELAAGLDLSDVGLANYNLEDWEFDALDLGISSLTNTSGGAVSIAVEITPKYDPSHPRAADRDPVSNPNGYCPGEVQTIDIIVNVAQPRLRNAFSINGREILFRAYPVPAYGYVFVQASETLLQDQSFELFNLHGQSLLRSQIPTGEHRVKLPLHHLSEGLYFLRINNPTGKDAVIKLQKL